MSDERTPKPKGITFKYHIGREGFASDYQSLMDGTRDAENNYRDIMRQNERDGLPVSEIQKNGLQVLQGQRSIADAITKNLVESAQRGETFQTGRRKGAISDKTKYIKDLANKNPHTKALALFIDADKKILGDMTVSTFATHVSKARKSEK
jgi:hypothetical protein